MLNGRVPPYNAEAEHACIGSILLNEIVYEGVIDIVDVSDFYIEANRKIFASIKKVIDNRVTLDIVTLGEQLASSGDLEKVGGAVALSGICDNVATSANAVHYAKIVREKSKFRRIIEISQNITEAGFSGADTGKIEDAYVALGENISNFYSGSMPHNVFENGDGVIELYDKIRGGYAGVMLPWDSINMNTMGMWPGTMTVFVSRPNVGKCVRGDTPVLDPRDGIYRPVKSVVDGKHHVLTRLSNGDIEAVEPDDFLYNGRKECLRIGLASGRELSGTHEHPVMTADGWKSLNEIKVGELIEIVGYVPEPTNKLEPALFEMFLLASTLAECCCLCGDSGVEFASENPDMVAFARRVAFGAGTAIRKTEGLEGCDWSVTWGDGGKCSFRGAINPVKMILDKYNCGNKEPKDKVIPEKVFSFSNDRLAWFLGVLWGYDGSVDKHCYSWGAVEDVHIILASEVMIRQIQHLLLRFGILSSVKYKEPMCDGNGFGGWKLQVHSVSLGNFRDSIDPIVSCKREVLNAVGCKSFQGWQKCWDEVVFVVDDGVQNVYDLTVGGSHSFVANDIVVHNSSLAVISSRHAWMNGERVLIVSPEMSKEEIIERFYVIHSGVSYVDAVKGTLGDFQLRKLRESIEESKGKSGLWIMDSQDDLSASGIEAAIKVVQPRLVSVDAVYRLPFRGDKFEKMQKILDWFGGACQKYDFAGCVFTQQNRTQEKSSKDGGGSRLGTIAFSDQIGMDAHAVYALEQDEDMRADKRLRIVPLKIRRGTKGKPVNVMWDFDSIDFSEIQDAGVNGYEDEDDIPF